MKNSEAEIPSARQVVGICMQIHPAAGNGPEDSICQYPLLHDLTRQRINRTAADLLPALPEDSTPPRSLKIPLPA